MKPSKEKLEGALWGLAADIRSGIQTPCGSDDGPRGATYSNAAYEAAAKKVAENIPNILRIAGF